MLLCYLLGVGKRTLRIPEHPQCPPTISKRSPNRRPQLRRQAELSPDRRAPAFTLGLSDTCTTRLCVRTSRFTTVEAATGLARLRSDLAAAAGPSLGFREGAGPYVTAFLDFPSEAKCQAAVAALAGADQINPSRGNHPNISPSATYRILCPLRRALKAKRYPAPAAWSLQRSGRASACLSAGRLNDGSSPADADICGIREA
jgi:hypothetical protein